MNNSNQTTIKKLSKEVLATLPEDVQEHYEFLWLNTIEKDKEIKGHLKTLNRIYPNKGLDKVMLTTNCLLLMALKFSIEAHTDFEREHILPEAYNFLTGLTHATYHHVDHPRFKKSNND